MLIKRVAFQGEEGPSSVSLRCPGCRRQVVLEGAGNDRRYISDNTTNYKFGQRTCPDSACGTHLFVVYRSGTESAIVATYPAERIDFDTTGLPERVVAAFEEAVSCHAAQCWAAAAMMVRKTLEELCADQEITDGNLFAKIQALKAKATLPPALLGGLDALRMLGNDAAHVDARAYDEVGQEEVEVALVVAKEILKAAYQMEAIVSRLTALQSKRDAADEPS